MSRICWSLLGAAAWPALAFAQATAPAASIDASAAFGARPMIENVSLSPDGSSIAYISPTSGQGSALYTVKIGSAPKRILAASGNPERLSRCSWSSNTRLVCTVYFIQNAQFAVISSTRIISINADGGPVELLTKREGENAWGHSFFGGAIIDWLPGEDGAILMGNYYIPESKAGSLIVKRDQGYGVDRIDTLTKASKRVVDPNSNAVDYISDGRGNVRVMATQRDVDGYSKPELVYRYNLLGKRDWKPLSVYNTLTDEGFLPVTVDPGENAAYGFRKIDGRLAVVKHALDGSETETTVYAHPQVDVDQLIRIGKARRVIGVSYATDHRYSVYFDKALGDLRTRLAKALGGGDLQLDIIASSLDEQKLVLRAGSDINPGQYYLFDRTTKQLGALFAERSALAGVTLAPVKSVMVKASDGVEIPAYLTLPPGSNGKNLPSIVMPHGGPGARDEWGFDWLAQFYAHQGYAVLQPNFRGSTGYGDDWLKINGFQSWRAAIGDVADSGRWLVAQGIANPAKLGIVGWSYGGYAALQSGVIAPGLFKAIVAIAPVTDFAELTQQSRNSTNKYITRDYIGTGPHIREGSPAQNAASITAPVLMFHGTDDGNVRFSHSKLMLDKLNNAGRSAELVTFDKLDHYLEDSAARAQMLKRSDEFLRAAFAK